MQTCYRHPDRETGVSCSNCGRPICPDCMTSTSVGMRCPECARQTTKVKRVGGSDDPVVTYVLIGINVVIALGTVLGGASATGDGLGSGALIEHGALSRDTIANGEYWRLVTAGFLHAGLLHLLFNMFSLYILGTMLEPIVGRLRFALIYFVSLLAGSFGALLLDPVGFTVGASGAVFGLMGAGVIVLRSRGISLMESGLGLWIGLNLLLSFRPGISLGGHLGGIVGGALAAALLVELQDRVRAPEAVVTGLTVALGAVAVAGAVVVSS